MQAQMSELKKVPFKTKNELRARMFKKFLTFQLFLGDEISLRKFQGQEKRLCVQLRAFYIVEGFFIYLYLKF